MSRCATGKRFANMIEKGGFTAFIIACLAAALTFALMAYVLFQAWDDFVESLKSLFRPEISSVMTGLWHENQWTKSRLLLCAVISLLVAVCAYAKFL